MRYCNYILIYIIFLLLCSCKVINKNEKENKDLLILKYNDSTSTYAYFDKNGNKALGDYPMIFTDTIRDYGIVEDSGFVLIDKRGKHIYTIFPFDNGPDITSDGLYRIIENGKIGYVDSLTSKLVIQPLYECAWPFENGKAKVSIHCNKKSKGEYTSWESNEWFYIDKEGHIVR